MKKALLFSAIALAAFAPMKVHATWPIPIERPSEWTIITSTEAVDNNGVGLENIPILGGKTGNIAHVIDDNPFTYWHSNWNQCNAQNDNHDHWFMIDRGELAAEAPFTQIAFQQRVVQVMENKEEAASWNGAIDTADVYLLDENPGLVGGYANMAADFNVLSTFRTENPTPTMDVDIDIFTQNPQIFKFTDDSGNAVEHTERYILVVITHTINPNSPNQPEQKFACLAGCNLYGEEIWTVSNSFPEPYNDPWNIEELKKTSLGINGRGTYALTISGGVTTTTTPYLQRACYRWFSHDDTCYDLTDLYTYQAFHGTEITITPTANDSWMHNYVYVDWDGTPGFNVPDDFLNDNGTPKAGCDLVSFAYHNGKNSNGESSAQQHELSEARSFTIPEDIAPGIYRVRYKVDWDNVQPQLVVQNNDDGSVNTGLGGVVVDFYLEILDPEGDIPEETKAQITELQPKAELLKSLNIHSSEVVDQWDGAIAAYEATGATLNEAIAVLNAYHELQRNVKPVSINITHKTRQSSTIGQKVNTERELVLTCSADVTSGTKAFTLEMAPDGSGFYLYNEYADKYLVHPTVMYAQASGTNNKANASVYNLDVWVTADGTIDNSIGFHSINNTARAYLHSNADDTLVGWDFDGDNSTWYILLVDDIVAAREHLAGKLSIVGDDIGQYHFDNTTESAARDLLADDNATVAELRDAAATSLNMPKAGHFYRFHYGNNYMSSSTTDNNRFKMEEFTELDHNSVFFYDGTYLVTYPEGLVMGNLDSGHSSVSYKGGVANSPEFATYAGHVQFMEASSEAGKYFVKFSNGRHLYHQNTYIDAGDSPDNSQGYRWEIADVTWLPIPHDGSDYLPFYSPVELGKCYGDEIRVGAHHSGAVYSTTEKVYIEALTHESLPAGIPVVAEYKGGIQANGCVYLPLNYTAAESVATLSDSDSANDLQGHYLAQTKADTHKYFTLNGTKFVEHTTGNYIPGFQSYIAVPTAEAKTEYALTTDKPTSINEIENASGVKTVYDLQGRKLAAPVKGINIVNGKKVLVK